jgi:type IV pilus assembly protein PilP
MNRLQLISLVVLGFGLTACEQQQTELQSWMKQEASKVTPEVAKIDEPKKFEPFRYDNAANVEPFSVSKLSKALEQAVKIGRSGLQPDLARRRESLEVHPLDTLRMVGHIKRSGQNFGLLLVESAVYPVKVGNYLGQNFGKIIKISETEIQLKELVQDATGDWVERESTLQLQEAVKKN